MPKRTRYEVLRTWDVSSADYTFYVSRITDWADGLRTVSKIGTGNSQWAARNAEHFGVEIEDETENEVRVCRYWDLDSAGWMFLLSMLADDGSWAPVASSRDVGWAKRQAAHFEVELEFDPTQGDL